MIKRVKPDYDEPLKLIKIPLYFKLKDEDEVVACEPLTKTHILTLTNSNANLFPIEEVTETSLASGGLQACKIKEKDELLLIKQVNLLEKVKINKKTVEVSKLALTHRGYIGQKY